MQFSVGLQAIFLNGLVFWVSLVYFPPLSETIFSKIFDLLNVSSGKETALINVAKYTEWVKMIVCLVTLGNIVYWIWTLIRYAFVEKYLLLDDAGMDGGRDLVSPLERKGGIGQEFDLVQNRPFNNDDKYQHQQGNRYYQKGALQVIQEKKQADMAEKLFKRQAWTSPPNRSTLGRKLGEADGDQVNVMMDKYESNSPDHLNSSRQGLFSTPGSLGSSSVFSLSPISRSGKFENTTSQGKGRNYPDYSPSSFTSPVKRITKSLATSGSSPISSVTKIQYPRSSGDGSVGKSKRGDDVKGSSSPVPGIFGSDYNSNGSLTPYSRVTGYSNVMMGNGHSYSLGTRSSANNLLKPYHTYAAAFGVGDDDSNNIVGGGGRAVGSGAEDGIGAIGDGPRNNNSDFDNNMKGPCGVIYGSKHLWQTLGIGHRQLALFTDRLRDWFSMHLLGPLVQSMDATELYFDNQTNNLKSLNINVILSDSNPVLVNELITLASSTSSSFTPMNTGTTSINFQQPKFPFTSTSDNNTNNKDDGLVVKVQERLLLERYLQIPIGFWREDLSGEKLRSYLISRIRTLAQGRFLPLFKWNGGEFNKNVNLVSGDSGYIQYHHYASHYASHHSSHYASHHNPSHQQNSALSPYFSGTANVKDQITLSTAATATNTSATTTSSSSSFDPNSSQSPYPNDTVILFHLFCTFLDIQLNPSYFALSNNNNSTGKYISSSILGGGGGGILGSSKSFNFTGNYVDTPWSQQQRQQMQQPSHHHHHSHGHGHGHGQGSGGLGSVNLRSPVPIIKMLTCQPPHFQILIRSGSSHQAIYDIDEGRFNFFHAIIGWLCLLDRETDGFVGPLDFSAKSIDLMSILCNQEDDYEPREE